MIKRKAFYFGLVRTTVGLYNHAPLHCLLKLHLSHFKWSIQFIRRLQAKIQRKWLKKDKSSVATLLRPGKSSSTRETNPRNWYLPFLYFSVPFPTFFCFCFLPSFDLCCSVICCSELRFEIMRVWWYLGISAFEVGGICCFLYVIALIRVVENY